MIHTFVEVPAGFRFGSMNCHTDSWDAYDGLRTEDGWIEMGLKRHWKQRDVGDGYVACHQPFEKRPDGGSL